MKRILLLIVLLIIPGMISAKDLEGVPAKALKKAFSEGETRGKASIDEIFYIDDASIEDRAPNKEELRSSPANKKNPLSAKEERPDEIALLLDEIRSLKKKEIDSKKKTFFTDSIEKETYIGTKVVYDFKEGKIFEVNTAINRVTDIELEKGEALIDTPVAGDTLQWKIKAIRSGKGKDKRTHLIVKPLNSSIETNLIIPTDRRVYHLKLISGDFYSASIKWLYDEGLDESFIASEEDETDIPFMPEALNFNYKILGDDYSWRPEQVFDDGKKTYVKMHSSISSLEAPVLFLLNEDDDAILTNYRVKGDYYIIDRLIYRAQMRVGKSNGIEIRSERYKESFWERIF